MLIHTYILIFTETDFLLVACTETNELFSSHTAVVSTHHSTTQSYDHHLSVVTVQYNTLSKMDTFYLPPEGVGVHNAWSCIDFARTHYVLIIFSDCVYSPLPWDEGGKTNFSRKTYCQKLIHFTTPLPARRGYYGEDTLNPWFGMPRF